MILALNGADFGEFGASYSSGIGNLQAALVALGKGIGDPTLMKVAVDGVMGPKTAAATNRALTVHLGAGQAPSNLRSGALPQATISSMASQITALITTEITRRGFPTPGAAKVPAKKATVARAVAPVYAPAAAPTALVPAAASPVYRVPAAASDGAGLDSIMKWAAIGVGVVALGGVAYYFVTRDKGARGGGLRARTGVPGGALRGLGTANPIDNNEREQWIKNDEGLWRWYQQESRHQKGGMRAFIKRNRAEIDAAIRDVRDREPPKTRFYGAESGAKKFYLKWFPANSAYGVVWGKQHIDIRGQFLFPSKAEAKSALARAGLKMVGKSEVVAA